MPVGLCGACCGPDTVVAPLEAVTVASPILQMSKLRSEGFSSWWQARSMEGAELLLWEPGRCWVGSTGCTMVPLWSPEQLLQTSQCRCPVAKRVLSREVQLNAEARCVASPAALHSDVAVPCQPSPRRVMQTGTIYGVLVPRSTRGNVANVLHHFCRLP